jgi:large subunit ribosomal protein L25
MGNSLEACFFLKNKYDQSHMITLHAHIRTNEHKADALRASGSLPAEMYGNGLPNSSLVIDRQIFKKAFDDVGYSNTVSIVVDEKPVSCLIHEIQVDPVSDMIIHVDFYRINEKEAVSVEVPLDFIGISPAVKAGQGVLEKMLHALEVSALPKNLPKELSVDIAVLVNQGDQIHARDIVLPQGVTLETDPEEIVAVITALHDESAEVSAGSIDFSAIAVEKKGKQEAETEE